MKKYVSLLLALAMVLGVLSGCAKDETTDAPTPGGDTPAPVPGGDTPAGSNEPAMTNTGAIEVPVVEAASYKKDVTVGVNFAFTMLDPHGTYNINHNNQTVMVYDTLLFWNTNTGSFEPELATEWKWLDDTTLNVKLRKGVKFHDGTELTAKDVQFSFERCIAQGSSGATVMKMIEQYEIVNDYEITFKLNEVNVDFLAYLTVPYASILSKDAVEKDPENGPKIGTGSWIYVDMVESDYMKLKRNDNTWRAEKPKTETMTIRTIPENSTRLIALQNGEIDVCFNPNATELDIIQQDKKLNLYIFDRTSLMYFAMNSQLAPGDDQNFRLAVSYAIDKEELALVHCDGRAKIADVNWGWATFGYDDTIPGIQRDLNKAKEYLAKTPHRKLEITCTSAYKVMAETMQAQLREAGIEVTVNEVQSAAQTAMTKFASATHQSMLFGLSWTEFGEDARRPYYSGSNANKAIVKNQEIYDLVDAAKKEFDEVKRKEMYSKIQKINQEQGYYIPLFFSQGFMATNKNAGGIRLEANSLHDISYLCVAEK